MVSGALGAFVQNTSADQGAHDSYGYRWTDSNSPTPSVSYNWVEINASGADTGLYGTYDEVGPIPIGFVFNYYGYAYANVYITTNGLMGFDGGYAYEYYNDQIPYSPSPDNIIAPYWAYSSNYYGTIYYQTIGVYPNRQMVIEWENVSSSYTSDLLTYEVLLNETGEIWFQYAEVGTDYGYYSTVGIENQDGYIGVQYSYETNSLSDGLAILFSTGSVMISPSQSGVGNVGTDVSYLLTVKNWQSVSDSFEITYNSSLGWAVSLFDSVANPLSDSDGDTIPDTGTVAAGASVSIEVRVSIPASPLAYQDITGVTATSYLNGAANDTCYLTTDVSGAWFASPHQDTGMDQEGIGFFDILTVNAAVYVRVTGYYYIEAYLHTAAESSISSDVSGWYYLYPGSNLMELGFNGYLIRESGVDGPYHVHMTLYDNSYDVMDTDVHYTGAYLATEFMLRPGQLGATHGDGAVDTDANGLFDTLFINATVLSNYDWDYYVYAYLYDSSSNYIGYAENYTNLPAGTGIVSLEFNAYDITEFGSDGYFYAYIYLYAYIDGYQVYMGSDTHQTGTYSISQFERKPILFSTPIHDYVNDTNSDGYYNFLQISATVDVAVEGDYTIVGILQADTWQPIIDTVTNNTHLTAGLHTIDFYFPGWLIRANADSDDMDVTLEAYSGSDLMDSLLYTTSTYYYYYDFELQPIYFTSPMYDYANDTDSDGYFNFLEISVTVDVLVEGDYTLVAILQADTYLGVIDTITTNGHFTVGQHGVDFYFLGWQIRANADSDDMDITLQAWGGADMIDEYVYTTWYYYYYYDFDSAPGWFAPPYSDYGLDTNSDSLYDYLVINVPVTVDTAGYYEVRAALESPVIETANVTTYIGVGTSTVEIRFTGWLIRTSGYNGPYDVYLYLYDSSNSQMDYDWYYTSAYAYTDFQGGPAVFGSPHEAYVQDTDSDGDYDGLFVNATVVVSSPGTFLVQGVLNDSAWTEIAGAGTWATLAAGTHVVQIAFPAWLISLNGVDDYFTVELSLYDANNNFLDNDSVTSGFYANESFDSTIPRIGSTWASTAPIIDGAISSGEWTGAALVDLATVSVLNGVVGSLLVMNDGTNLYIAYDAYGDTHEDTYDMSAIGFDTGNDALATSGHEDAFALGGAGFGESEHLTYSSGTSWSTHCYPFDTAYSEHDTLAGHAGFGPSTGHAIDHMMYEYSIPLALLDTTPGSLIGFLGGISVQEGLYDDFNATSSSWPTWFPNAPSLSQYGDLLLAVAPTLPPVTTASATGTGGVSGWYLSQVNVTLSATGGDGGVDYTEHRLDGGTWTRYSSAIAVTVDGTHTLEYRSVDMAAQVETTKSLTIKIDTIKPVSALSLSGSWFWLNGTDATSGVSSIAYSLDGGNWVTYNGKVNITSVGTHTISYYCVDKAGNREDAKNETVVVKKHSDAGISSDMLLIGGLLAAVIVAALIVLALLMRRRKGQSPTTYAPVQAQMPPPPT